MHNSKKAILVSLSFVFLIIIVSYVFISPYVNSESEWYHDKNYRNELEGSLDSLVVGSSGGTDGFRTTVFNSETGHHCYNICGGAISGRAKIRLLEEEIYRNPINTVIATIDDDELGFDPEKRNGEGEIYYLPRINDNMTKLNIILNDVLVKDYANIYATYLNEGSKYLISKITGNAEPELKRGELGWRGEESTDITVSEEELKEKITQQKKIVIHEKNKEYFCDLIEECQDMNIEVILLILPISESRILEYSNYDEWHDIYESIAQKYNCVFIDMNLLKNRNEIVSEKESFFNENHLGISGATSSTKEFCRIYNKICADEDVSNMFYDSYEEAIKYFDYYNKYKELIQEQK